MWHRNGSQSDWGRAIAVPAHCRRRFKTHRSRSGGNRATNGARGDANGCSIRTVKRRAFLSTMGAAAVWSPGLTPAQPAQGGTVLYDGRTIKLDRTSADPAKGDALWIDKSD